MNASSKQTCSPRSYPEDVSMTELNTGELFATMALRFWAACYRDPAEDNNRWQIGFAAADISDEGATAFNALFLIVAASAQRPLDVRCPKCLNLGDDEANFLQILGLLQRDCVTGAELLLMSWVPPAAVRSAMPFAAALAEAMYTRGLRIPHRPSEDALRHRFEQYGTGAYYDNSSLALIH